MYIALLEVDLCLKKGLVEVKCIVVGIKLLWDNAVVRGRVSIKRMKSTSIIARLIISNICSASI